MNKAEKFAHQAKVIRRAKILDKMQADSAAGLYQSFFDENKLDPEVIEELKTDGFIIKKSGDYRDDHGGQMWKISWRDQ